MKLNDIVNEADYGRYYCSTDKKWKTRKGPKQTRKTESVEQGIAESEYGIPDETPGRLPDGPKMTFGQFKKMWPGVILKRPSGGSLAGSVVADVEGWMNNPKSVWEPLESMSEGALDDIEDTKQFKAAVALAKSQKAIRQAKDGKDAKYYADGTKVTPAEVARRAAERKAKKQGVAEGVTIVDQDSDLDQQIFTLNVDGEKVSFTYWDYEDKFQNPDIKEIFSQAKEQLPDLTTEQHKDIARAVFKSFQQGVAEASWINGKKQDDKELVWKQTGMSYEKAVEKYGKEHVRLGGKNKLGQQTVEVHVPLVSEKKKQRLDPDCWDNKKIGNPKTKMKGGVRVNNCVPEAAPGAVRAAGGLALGSLTGVGGALIGQMFAPFLGGATGGVVGAVGGYKAGAEMTDALWDKVSSMLGGKEKAVYAGIEHAKAANAGEKTFNYNGKEFPVTLAPQEVKPAISALDSVKESILGELTGWGQASKAKKPIPKRNEPTAGERLAKSGDKRSELQRKFDAGKKNWFAEEETYDGDEFYEAYGDLWFNEDEQLDEAEYQGRKVPLGKPMRGDVKKFKVYVKNEKGNVVKVNFGDPDMKIKKSNPARRKSFRARHNCANPGPRTKARYWSCRKW